MLLCTYCYFQGPRWKAAPRSGGDKLPWSVHAASAKSLPFISRAEASVGGRALSHGLCSAGQSGAPGSDMACRLEEGPFCAPCGAVLAGASVALTFSYDYFDVVVLDTEFEVEPRRAPYV